MLTIAASDLGDYMFLVIMLVIGLINWISNKLKEGKAAPPAPRPAQSPLESAPPAADAEAERMRRFLEALGVPADDAPPLPQAAPAAPRPAFGAPRSAPPPLPEREQSLDEAETTTEPVEHIHIPELRTDSLPEFETISSRVSADSDGDFVTVSSAISAVPECPRHPEAAPTPAPAQGAVRDTIVARLRSRPDLRAALILSEILGRPKALRA